jgi:hypothetical protein
MLINCKECNSEISDTADSCPKCGFSNKKPQKSNLGCLLFIFFGMVFVIFILPSIINKRPPQTTQIVNQSEQNSLLAIIDKYKELGIVYKIEIGTNVPRVYVTKLFNQLNIDDKTFLLNVIYTYYKNIDNSVVLVSIYDTYTGEHIGKFSDYGLDFD